MVTTRKSHRRTIETKTGTKKIFVKSTKVKSTKSTRKK